MRFWFEPSFDLISFNSVDGDNIVWCPHNKGGAYRKWYGNLDYVIWWKNSGKDIKEHPGSRPQNIDKFFKQCLTWSTLSSSNVAFRKLMAGCTSDSKGSICIPQANISSLSLLGFLNSKVVNVILSCIAPTLDFSVGAIKKIPYKEESKLAENFVEENINMSKVDWDAFETSWDFQKHPLLCKVSTIEETFEQWQTECDDRFNQLKANEEELNRIFIDIYDLQEELFPEVEDKDVTVRKANLGRDIRSFISYAVGCMFGRYSLDVDGLVYAGGEWDTSKYTSFPADKYNIIPICSDEYFEDDIVNRFIEFVKIVYGVDTLDENLKFIADALGGKGQPKAVIRNYFLNEFYADHCKIYQKRPIYWLFDSGKKNGFKCLIYMHRYQPDTIARIRTDYVHGQQARYRTAIEDLEKQIANASTSERVKLNKKLASLQAQDAELRTYEEKIHHLADQMISIDLDDGVRVNYAKFQDVLAKIK